MKYLKTFDTNADYDAAPVGSPIVSLISENNKVHFDGDNIERKILITTNIEITCNIYVDDVPIGKRITPGTHEFKCMSESIISISSYMDYIQGTNKPIAKINNVTTNTDIGTLWFNSSSFELSTELTEDYILEDIEINIDATLGQLFDLEVTIDSSEIGNKSCKTVISFSDDNRIAVKEKQILSNVTEKFPIYDLYEYYLKIKTANTGNYKFIDFQIEPIDNHGIEVIDITEDPSEYGLYDIKIGKLAVIDAPIKIRFKQVPKV